MNDPAHPREALVGATRVVVETDHVERQVGKIVVVATERVEFSPDEWEAIEAAARQDESSPALRSDVVHAITCVRLVDHEPGSRTPYVWPCTKFAVEYDRLAANPPQTREAEGAVLTKQIHDGLMLDGTRRAIAMGRVAARTPEAQRDAPADSALREAVHSDLTYYRAKVREAEAVNDPDLHRHYRGAVRALEGVIASGLGAGQRDAGNRGPLDVAESRIDVDRLWGVLSGFGVLDNGTWVSFRRADAEQIAAEYAGTEASE